MPTSSRPIWPWPARCARSGRLYWADALVPAVRVLEDGQNRELATVKAPLDTLGSAPLSGRLLEWLPS